MNRSQTKQYKCALLLTAAAFSIAASCSCFGFDYHKGENNSVFSHQANKSRAELVPVRMMTDEQLFMSVNAERDHSMSLEQQRMNHNWLVNFRSNEYSGSAAIRNVLRTTFYNFRPLLYKAQADTEDSSIKKRSAFTELNNYRLSLSNKKMIVGFKYQF